MLVLVVDDDARIRRATSSALVSAGHDVIEAGDGAEALATFRANRAIALIITDVLMPVMNGVAFADAVRADCPSQPILFMSGDLGEVPRAALGCSPLIAKPFTIATLEASIAALGLS